METIQGTPAVEPITHTFFDEEAQIELQIVAETPISARNLLAACGVTKLVYCQSVDAAMSFVYDFPE